MDRQTLPLVGETCGTCRDSVPVDLEYPTNIRYCRAFGLGRGGDWPTVDRRWRGCRSWVAAPADVPAEAETGDPLPGSPPSPAQKSASLLPAIKATLAGKTAVPEDEVVRGVAVKINEVVSPDLAKRVRRTLQNAEFRGVARRVGAPNLRRWECD